MKRAVVLAVFGATLLARPAQPQGDSVRAVLEREALKALAAHHATGQPDIAKLQLAFDPTILRGSYDRGIRRDTASSPPAPRDAATVAALAQALGGVALPMSGLRDCLAGTATPSCPVDNGHFWIVAMGVPRISGDSASVLLRTGPREGAGDGRGLVGRTLTTYVAQFIRTNGHWTLRCFGAVGTDFVPSPDVVESRCRPPGGTGR